MLHWQGKLDVKVVKRVKEYVRPNPAKRTSEVQKDDEEGSPEARKRKKPKQADRTQTPPPKEKQPVSAATPNGSMVKEPAPKVEKSESYCLRDLVHTLCGGPLKCMFPAAKCRYVHATKEELDLERLKSDIFTMGDNVKGLDAALRVKLLEAAEE